MQCPHTALAGLDPGRCQPQSRGNSDCPGLSTKGWSRSGRHCPVLRHAASCRHPPLEPDRTHAHKAQGRLPCLIVDCKITCDVAGAHPMSVRVDAWRLHRLENQVAPLPGCRTEGSRWSTSGPGGRSGGALVLHQPGKPLDYSNGRRRIWEPAVKAAGLQGFNFPRPPQNQRHRHRR